jgi:Protein of unknown function (DUF3046)
MIDAMWRQLAPPGATDADEPILEVRARSSPRADGAVTQLPASPPARVWTGGPWLPGSLAAVRLTVFWERMRAQFGEAYAESVAKDQVIAALGDRTVNQALADGVDAKTVWRAVCETFDVPQRLR